MHAREQVERGAHGLYRAWTSPDLLPQVEAPEIMAHGLQIVAKMPPNGGRALPGALQSTFGAMGWERNASAKSLYKRDVVGDRSVTLEVHPATGSLVVSVRASSAPLRTDDLDGFFAQLKGYCAALGVDLDSPTTRVANVELNRDYEHFAVKGLTDVTLRTFRNAWLHLYQKRKETLRMEVRVAPVDLTLREAVQLLQGLNPPRTVYTPDADPLGPEVA